MLDQLWEEFDERKDLDEKEQWVQRNGEDTTNAIIVLHIDLWLAGSFVDFKTGYAPGSLKGKQKKEEILRELHGKNCAGVRNIYNDGSFQPQRSVGEGSQSAESAVSNEQ